MPYDPEYYQKNKDRFHAANKKYSQTEKGKLAKQANNRRNYLKRKAKNA